MKVNQSLLVLILFFSVLLLLPFSRFAELPILILAIIGIIAFISNKVELQSSSFKLLSLVYLCYFTMIIISAIDSYWSDKTWLVGLASLRFYLATCALLAYLKAKHTRVLIILISYFTIFMAIDALIQYFLGYDLIGRESYPGRLNGLFGENHAKLGPLMALLFPISLIAFQNYKPTMRWIAVLSIIFSILLSGTRSAWIMMTFTIIAYFFYHVKQKRTQLAVKSLIATAFLVISLWVLSPEFQKRIDRSLAIFQGSEQAIDFALANRLSIWKTSINMIKSHPINGVGAHAFRKAYPEFSENDDVWQLNGGVGMHAHHWLLEVLSDTGIIGLSLIIFAILRLYKFIKPNFQRPYVWAFTVSIITAFLPITSTYSIFASFWSICIWIIGSGLILVSMSDE
jgi:O-antigen ligase